LDRTYFVNFCIRWWYFISKAVGANIFLSGFVWYARI